jgi:hypothetical protein
MCELDSGSRDSSVRRRANEIRHIYWPIGGNGNADVYCPSDAIAANLIGDYLFDAHAGLSAPTFAVAMERTRAERGGSGIRALVERLRHSPPKPSGEKVMAHPTLGRVTQRIAVK